jgi:glycosyltransferase involved in cell wall biosynthesis
MIAHNFNHCRWWIIEDALRDRKGHWAEYLQTFKRGLSAEGDQVSFFASKECVSEVAAAFEAKAILPKSIWARMSDGAPKWRRLLRIPSHGLATYRAVTRLFDACSARNTPCSTLPPDRALPDFIFVPTVLVHHLIGWIPLIKSKLRNKSSSVLLFFPNAPVYLGEDGKPHLSSEPTAKLFRLCIRFLAKEVARGKVILGAETWPMAKALSEVTGVPFVYLPHPVEVSDEVLASADRASMSPTEERPILFGCYGVARHEKGSDTLQSAIRVILEQKPSLPVSFAFQWIENFRDEHGRLIELDPWLKGHPKVRVIDRYFEDGEYEQQLTETDVAILPYRRAYSLRVSRVVIEAMCFGMPVIATAGTTLHQQAEEFGVTQDCSEDDCSSLVQAIMASVERFESFSSKAKRQASVARNHFSVREFRRRLITACRGEDQGA